MPRDTCRPEPVVHSTTVNVGLGRNCRSGRAYLPVVVRPQNATFTRVVEAATLPHMPVVWVLVLGGMGIRRITRVGYRTVASARHRRDRHRHGVLISVASAGRHEKTVFELNNGTASNQLGLAACHF